jgi:hypothetical protein
MAQHEITYDGDGLSTNDPWSLEDYLREDGLTERDREKVRESVLSWLGQYDGAACDITEAMKELET